MQFCETVNQAATELGYNAVFYNFLDVVGNNHSDYGDYEYKLIEVIPYSRFSGIIIDEESFKIKTTVEKLVTRIRERATCPVISASSIMDGFYNLSFDDDAGIELIVRHIHEHHGCKRIGFMSGPLKHMDGVKRYNAFKAAMTKLGLPEEGAGIFEGDFWFNKGREAADFFITKCKEIPEAVICANDYMAMALIKGFKDRGFRVPEDIIVTGFDGVKEGQLYIPRLTSVDRRRDDTAIQAVNMINNISRGAKYPGITLITPKLICSCLSPQHGLQPGVTAHRRSAPQVDTAPFALLQSWAVTPELGAGSGEPPGSSALARLGCFPEMRQGVLSTARPLGT